MPVANSSSTMVGNFANNRDKLLGFACIVLSASVWIISSYWVNSLENKGLDPLFLTSLANCMFSVLIPVRYVGRCILKLSKQIKQREFSLTPKDKYEGEDVAILPSSGQEMDGIKNSSAGEHDIEVQSTLSKKDYFLRALLLWPLFIVALYIYNWTFLRTSVMSNTILSIGTTGLFTFMLEVLVLKADFSLIKLGAVLFCVTGTVLWTYGNQNDEPNQSGHKHNVWGDILCIISACIYSTFATLMRKFLPEHKEADMVTFWGFLGIINIVVLLPVNIIASSAGLYDLSSIPAKYYGAVMLKGLMDNLLSNLIWSQAVLLVGTTVANVGTSIEIPIVLVVDLITRRATYLYRATSAGYTISGAIVILVGFFGLTI